MDLAPLEAHATAVLDPVVADYVNRGSEAGVTKQDVRVLARALGLKDWDRPSSACLSSRIPYGARITPERLRRVEVKSDAPLHLR